MKGGKNIGVSRWAMAPKGRFFSVLGIKAGGESKPRYLLSGAQTFQEHDKIQVLRFLGKIHRGDAINAGVQIGLSRRPH